MAGKCEISWLLYLHQSNTEAPTIENLSADDTMEQRLQKLAKSSGTLFYYTCKENIEIDYYLSCLSIFNHIYLF